MDNAVDLSAKPEPIKVKQTSAPINTAAGSSATPKSSGTNPIIFIVIGFVLILCCCIIGAVACWFITLSASKSSVNTPTTSNGQTVTPLSLQDVGKPQKVDDLTYTLNGAQQVGSDYVFDITISNNSNQDKDFSSILMINLKKNNDNIGYSQDILYDIPVTQRLDKIIPANGVINGKVAFSVTDSPTSLNLELLGGILSDNKIVVRIK